MSCIWHPRQMTADANLGCLQISVLCSKIDLSGKKEEKLDFSRSLFWCFNIQYLTLWLLIIILDIKGCSGVETGDFEIFNMSYP